MGVGVKYGIGASSSTDRSTPRPPPPTLPPFPHPAPHSIPVRRKKNYARKRDTEKLMVILSSSLALANIQGGKGRGVFFHLGEVAIGKQDWNSPPIATSSRLILHFLLLLQTPTNVHVLAMTSNLAM